MTDVSTDKIVSLIAKAAANRDFPAINHYLTELRQYLHISGAPIDDEIAFRLIDSLSKTSTYESMPQAALQNPYALIEQIIKAADTDAPPELRAELGTIWDKLYAMLASPGVHLEGVAIDQLMSALKSTCAHFDLVARSADRFITRGQDSASMRVHYAQALIDTGQPVAAINILQEALRIEGIRKSEKYDVHGLLGRAHKQIYVNHANPKQDQGQLRKKYEHHLGDAIQYYESCFNLADPGENYWQGINLVALLCLAERHGVVVRSAFNPREIATDIVSRLEPKVAATNDNWLELTLGEAYLALGNYDKAMQLYKAALVNPEMKPFNVGSALRQLTEVWGAQIGGDGAGAIALMLKEHLANMKNEEIVITGSERHAISEAAGMANGTSNLETNIPGGKYIKFETLITIVERAKSVAKILTPQLGPCGTGFLIKASDIHPDYGDQNLLLTNAHVIWDKNWNSNLTGEHNALDPEEARVVFEAEQPHGVSNIYTCQKEAIWQSPSYLHDVCLIPLNESVSHMPAVPLAHPTVEITASSSENGNEGTQVAVVGHPRNESLSLSIMGSIENQNGVVVDYGPVRKGDKDPIFLHYKTPTQPGNSGSPVFDTNNWRLVGIHHAGFNELKGRPKLNSVVGNNFANEGIFIGSIRRAARQHARNSQSRFGLSGNRLSKFLNGNRSKPK